MMVGLFSGCVETRVVHNKPPLAGLPGVTMNEEMVIDPDRFGRTSLTEETLTEPTVVDPDAHPAVQAGAAVEEPDGSLRLLMRSGKDLIYHIAWTVRDDEEKLFTEQVLSERTRQEFYGRGYDPAIGFAEVKRRRKDLEAMVKVIPMAEMTPGVMMEPQGRNVFRIRARGDIATDLKWKGFDMILEKGQWRLRWFVD